MKLNKKPLVTVISSSIGHPELGRNVKSVLNQSHENVQHLFIVDGSDNWYRANEQLEDVKHSNLDIVYLPYSTGKDRYNGHRNLAAGVYLAEGDYIMFLDDDNWLEPDHIKNCLQEIESDAQKNWTFSFRNIMGSDGGLICRDDCESLGAWPSIVADTDYFVDLNCYFLRKPVAIQLTPLMYRKFREPGQPEIDRIMCECLRKFFGPNQGTKKYTVNYTVGTTALSSTADFFIEGNKRMLEKHQGNLPWSK